MKLQSLMSNMREKEEKVQDVNVLKRKDSYEDVSAFFSSPLCLLHTSFRMV